MAGAIDRVLHKRSSVFNHIPKATGLSYGEIAINYSGGGIYIPKE